MKQNKKNHTDVKTSIFENNLVGRERFEPIEAWRYLPQIPLFFYFMNRLCCFLSIVRKTVERFYFVEVLCEFVRASRIQMSINVIGFFFKRSSILGDFSHECRVFLTFLCWILYVICMDVVNTIHYVVNSGIHDVFVYLSFWWGLFFV